MQGRSRAPQGRLGLPRPAGRAGGREGARLLRQAGHRGVRRRGVQRQVPRERAAPRRRVRAHDRRAWATGSTWPTPTGRWTPSYVESVWWSLKQISDKGLLVEDHRVAPYCPRCGTALSDHEVAQGYQTVVDPSVYVRFPVTSGPLRTLGAALLVWTTTPWTLVSNTAVAVHPGVTYVAARTAGERGARRRRAAAGACLGDDVEVLERFPGTALEHTTLRAAVRAGRHPGRALRRRSPTTSPTESGTGLVHQSPAFGADDLAVARALRPAGRQPGRGPTARSSEHLPLVGGLFFKAADAALVADLRERGPAVPRAAVRAQLPALLALRHRAALLRAAELVHPHDRDQGPAARGERADRLVPGDDQARPLRRLARATTSTGRCRATATGARRCRSGAAPPTRRTGRRRLARRARRRWPGRSCRRSTRTGRTSTTSSCPAARAAPRPGGCPRSSTAGTTPGSMPFAQVGYPHVGRRAGLPGAVHLRGDRPDARLVLHADGGRDAGVRPLVVRDRALPRAHPRRRGPQDEQAPRQRPRPVRAVRAARRRRAALVHALRRQPVVGPARRPRAGRGGRPQGPADLLEHRRRSSRSTPTSTAGTPGAPADRPSGPLLDRWALSQVHADRARGDRGAGGLRLAARRAAARAAHRRPVQLVRPPLPPPLLGRRPGRARHAARVPVRPDAAAWRRSRRSSPSEVWDALFAGGTTLPDSVHLARVAAASTASLVDAALARRWRWCAGWSTSAGRPARSRRSKTRQPLAARWCRRRAGRTCRTSCAALVSAELNVVDARAARRRPGRRHASKANFRALGKRFGKGVQAVAAAVAAADAAALAAGLRAGTASVVVDGEPVALSPDEVVVTETPRTGWAVAQRRRRDGRARPRRSRPSCAGPGWSARSCALVQDARKSTGLEVSDRIELWWQAVRRAGRGAARRASDRLAEEVLAVRVEHGTRRPPTSPCTATPTSACRFQLRVAGG